MKCHTIKREKGKAALIFSYYKITQLPVKLQSNRDEENMFLPCKPNIVYMELFMEPEIRSQTIMLSMIISAFKYLYDYGVLSHVLELFLLTMSLEL